MHHDDDRQRPRAAAFTAAFPELYPRAARVAERILGDRAAAHDVAAETLARAYERWDRIGSPDGQRTGWVLRVASNLAIDATRRTAPVELVESAAPGRADIADGLVQRLALAEALRALPARQREAVVLRYVAGFSQADTAAALGVSTGTVVQHVHRGLAALRRHLGAALPEPAHVKGATMRITTIEEAAALPGTDHRLEGRVTGRLAGVLWHVDVGIPAVLRSPTPDDDLTGRTLDCLVVEVDREHERVLTAPADTYSAAAEAQRRRELLEGLEVGSRHVGQVHAIVPFGAFVDVGGVHGLLHRSELGDEELQLGQQLAVEVLAVDPDMQRCALGLAA